MKLIAVLVVILSATSWSQTAHKIMIFGGQDHKTYLGCLNCSKFASDSVLNKYGEHGSAYASDSIFNPYGEFGGRYSSNSPCNPYASDPPVIVDERGNYYGELTLNTFRLGRAQSGTLNSWLQGVCAAE